MKKIFTLIIFQSLLYILPAQVPQELIGIWNGSDRYLFLGDEDKISIVLKSYYGWYYDRAAEPKEYKISNPTAVNAALSSEAQLISAFYEQIVENIPAWEMSINYGGKYQEKIPIAVWNGKIYLNFLIKDSSKSVNEANVIEKNEKFYMQGINQSKSIRISGRLHPYDVISWYFTKNGIYRLRFWETDMEFDEDADAIFYDGNEIFKIKKHIKSADRIFTCAEGRRSAIRNVKRYSTFPYKYETAADGNLFLIGEPYLTKVENKTSKEKLIEIINQANSKRKPPSPPLFEQKELDWHWDLINELEKGNKLIEDVRKRQKEFAPYREFAN